VSIFERLNSFKPTYQASDFQLENVTGCLSYERTKESEYAGTISSSGSSDSFFATANGLDETKPDYAICVWNPAVLELNYEADCATKLHVCPDHAPTGANNVLPNVSVFLGDEVVHLLRWKRPFEKKGDCLRSGNTRDFITIDKPTLTWSALDAHIRLSETHV